MGLLLAMSLSVSSCSKDDEPNNGKSNTEIVLDNGKSKEAIQLYAEETTTEANKPIKFTTQGAWRAVVEDRSSELRAESKVQWLKLSQYSGDKAGTYELKLTIEPNTTSKDRKAVIRITSGSEEIEISITQRSTTKKGEVLKPEKLRLVKEIIVNSKYYSYSSKKLEEGEINKITFEYDKNQSVNKIVLFSPSYAMEGKNTYNITRNDESIIISCNGQSEKREYVAYLNQERKITRSKYDFIDYNTFKNESSSQETSYRYNKGGQVEYFKRIEDRGRKLERYYFYNNGVLDKFKYNGYGSDGKFREEDSAPLTSINTNLCPNKLKAKTNIDINQAMMFVSLGEKSDKVNSLVAEVYERWNMMEALPYFLRLFGNQNPYLIEKNVYFYRGEGNRYVQKVGSDIKYEFDKRGYVRGYQVKIKNPFEKDLEGYEYTPFTCTIKYVD